MKLANLHCWVFSIDVSFMILILYPSYPRCYLWGKRGEGCGGLSVLFLTTACESTIISK